MADFYIAYINPFRFRRNVPANDMPRIDEMENGTQYYKGIYPLENYKADWKLNEEIVIQIQTDLSLHEANNIKLKAFNPSATIDISPTNVTPTGWKVNGNNGFVLNYYYTPTSKGEYYFITDNISLRNNYISDKFYVDDNEKNLVEIKYSDTDNRFDGVFYDGTTQIWEPKAYFTGISIPGKPENESSIYTDDQSKPVRTKGTTQRTINVKFTDITTNHYSQLIDILTCDTNYINNQPCIMVDNFDSEETEKSDGVTTSINMIRVEDNNFVKNY